MPPNKTIHHYGTNSVQVVQSMPVQTPNNTMVWGWRDQLKWPPRMHRNRSDNRIPQETRLKGVAHKNLKSSHKGPWEKIKEKSRILKNVQWSLVMGSPGGGLREKKGEDLAHYKRTKQSNKCCLCLVSMQHRNNVY